VVQEEKYQGVSPVTKRDKNNSIIIIIIIIIIILESPVNISNVFHANTSSPAARVHLKGAVGLQPPKPPKIEVKET
jgi:flagellar basal body-associated protein FliL